MCNLLLLLPSRWLDIAADKSFQNAFSVYRLSYMYRNREVSKVQQVLVPHW